MHPKQIIQRKQEHLTELQRRAHSAIKLSLAEQSNLLSTLLIRFENQSPHARVREAKLKLMDLQKQMHRNIQFKLEQKQQSLQALVRTLDAISPLGTLQRGYAIASHSASGQILLDSKQVAKGDPISIQLAKGQVSAIVSKKFSDKSSDTSSDLSSSPSHGKLKDKQ